ncbi:MAG TPA: hypothetical protein VFF06_13030 [Polyangia bacterium]|nr:hypothetical protein [Polyangia bacterium]
MSAVKRSVMLGLAVLTVGGCGSPLSSFDGFCDAFAGALCAKLVACPGAPQPLAAECMPDLSGSVCFCGMNAIANGEEKYHSEKAQACLDAVNQLTCSTVSMDSVPAACSLVYGLPSGAMPHCPPMVGPYPDGGGTD